MMSAAYWIKGNKIVDVGMRTHIQHIIQEPEFFGLTKKQVNAVYKKHRETLYAEGKAREELVKMTTKDGWVRVRKYEGQGEYWSIQFDRYRARKKIVQNFVLWALSKKVMNKHDTLMLVGFDDGSSEQIEPLAFLKEGKTKVPEFTVIYLTGS